jgi:hypothetical protein
MAEKTKEAPKNGGKQEFIGKNAEAAPQKRPNLEKKITTRVVGLSKTALQKMVVTEDGENNKKNPRLYSIIGICTGYKTGESSFGGWVGFIGQFEATRFSDEERFISPVAFIPEPASSMMLSAITQLEKRQMEVNLKFAFIIGVKWSESAIGYEYTVEPVMQAAQNDALAELREQMNAHLPQLTQQ